MNDSPVVSVVMVFHRDQPFLRPAIQSVRAQTLREWELILVDNGAAISANSLAPLSEDERIRWVRLPSNLGIPGGHNAGVAAARGEFIALLDYDDVMLPQRLEKQIGLLRSRPDLGLVSSCAQRIDESGSVIGPEFSLVGPGEQYPYTQYAAPVVTPAYSGRRDIFARFPYRPEFSWAADFDFLARAAEQGEFGSVPEVLLQYRWYAQQTTQLKRAAIEQNCTAIRLLTARRRAGKAEDFSSAVQWLANPAPPPVESCRFGARQCLREGFHILAAYHARRMISIQRTPQVLLAAGRLALSATRSAPANTRSQTWSMFCRGPVKALNLLPASGEKLRAPVSS